MSELLGCPFCGGTSIDPHGWASTETKGPACDDCGASAGSTSDSPAKNIEAWNRRALEGARVREDAAEDTARLDWLSSNRNAELSFEGWEEAVWQIHTVNGGRNDREWTLRGEAPDLRDAIDAARRVQACLEGEA